MLAVALAWVAVMVLHAGLADLTLATGHEQGSHPAPAVIGQNGPIALGMAALPLWALMSIAMMVPATLPAARHVALNSLRWRRQRAIAEFLVVYLGVWVAFGLIALSGLSFLEGRLAAHIALGMALSAAAIWQLLPYQQRFLRACHQTVPLPPKGWLAAAGCARFGLRHGTACLGACWPLMLVMAVMVHQSVLWMVVLTAIVSTKKLLPRSDRISRPLAFVLGACALSLLFFEPVRSVSAEFSAREDRDDLGGRSSVAVRHHGGVTSRLGHSWVNGGSARPGAGEVIHRAAAPRLWLCRRPLPAPAAAVASNDPSARSDPLVKHN
jgi:predicted metal-binding membrane protein